MNWIDNEIKLACEHENEYGIAIYKSVAKAYKAVMKSLEKDGHSGYSYNTTITILNRLLNRKPLTPLKEDEFVKDEFSSNDKKTWYKSPRYMCLSKIVNNATGDVEYLDIDRVVIVDQYGLSYIGNYDYVKEFIPDITFPYMPLDNPYEIHEAQFTYEPTASPSIFVEYGVYNATFVDYISKPNGERINVNKLFVDEKEVECTEEMANEIKKVVKKAVEDFEEC